MQRDQCRHCRHYPSSPRIFGYCSWDCHDADGDDERQDHAPDDDSQPLAA
jgi:hypothetical protein